MSLGIDIGSKTIKMVELGKDGNSWKLKGAGAIDFSGNLPDQITSDKDAFLLSATIKKLHSQLKVSSKEVVFAIPEDKVFTRSVKFPFLTDQEIASAVKWEAEQYIPIPIAEAVLQHQVLERKESAIPPEVEVLLVAAPKNLLEKYVRVIQMAGLTPIAIETELIALTRALATPDKTVMIIDFGSKSTDLAIAKNARLYFSRTIPTAGEAFTRAVANNLSISYQQAEEYKRAYGLSGEQVEGKIKGAIDPVFRIVTDEIKKAIHFYQSEEKGDSPNLVILSGGTSGMPEIVPAFAKILGIEVVIGNPFAKVSLTTQMAESLASYAPLYSIAVGLALREG